MKPPIKYLHIGTSSVFFGPLIDTIEREFSIEEHLFILTKTSLDGDLAKQKCVRLFNAKYPTSIYYYVLIIWHALRAEKIFFHGLFDPKSMAILYLTKFWEKKAFWVAWGGDLYDRYHPIKGWGTKLLRHVRRSIINRVGHIVTYIRGDYERAAEWFGCTAKYHECFMYPSNLYKELPHTHQKGTSLNIMVGNSAANANKHAEIFTKLAKGLPSTAKVYAPLSYGDKNYKEKVLALGYRLLGEKFVPITELLGANEYTKFLQKMDVVIFNHPFQQAMGNTIASLGLGKIVYLREGTSQWELFRELGVIVHSTKDLEGAGLNLSCYHYASNVEKIREHFSYKRYVEQLAKLFKSSSHDAPKIIKAD